LELAYYSHLKMLVIMLSCLSPVAGHFSIGLGVDPKVSPVLTPRYVPIFQAFQVFQVLKNLVLTQVLMVIAVRKLHLREKYVPLFSQP